VSLLGDSTMHDGPRTASGMCGTCTRLPAIAVHGHRWRWAAG